MPPHARYPGFAHISLEQLLALDYKEQAIWFLNGFWDEPADPLAAHAAEVWQWTKTFAELDSMQSAGTELDPIMSARFLERTEQTLTVLERKAALKELDVNNDGKMALIEYLMHRFNATSAATLAGKQGKAVEIAACRAVIDEALALLPEVEAKLEAQLAAKARQSHALAAARVAKAEAEAALGAQRAAEGTLRAALSVLEESKAELLAAVGELERQEQAVAAEAARLEQRQSDPASGAVARGRAAHQLSALRAEDPLPLRKAKITQEAALRQVRKKESVARAAADESAAVTAVCAGKFDTFAGKERVEEQSARALATAVTELEQTYTELTARMGEAQAAIEALKQEACGLGAVWWMERELFEADECLPAAKQQYDHSAPFSFVPRAPPHADGAAALRKPAPPRHTAAEVDCAVSG